MRKLSRSRRKASGRAFTVLPFHKKFEKGLTNGFFCDIIQNTSNEEDKQRIANVHREPVFGASRR